MGAIGVAVTRTVTVSSREHPLPIQECYFEWKIIVLYYNKRQASNKHKSKDKTTQNKNQQKQKETPVRDECSPNVPHLCKFNLPSLHGSLHSLQYFFEKH